MKSLYLTLAAGALFVGACATPPASAPSFQEQQLIQLELVAAPAPDRPEILLAVAMEVGARYHCPTGALESQLLFSGRLSFDLLVRPRIQEVSGLIVDRLRAATNAACAIADTPPPG